MLDLKCGFARDIQMLYIPTFVVAVVVAAAVVVVVVQIPNMIPCNFGIWGRR